MSINKLHKAVLDGEANAERELFGKLSERFLYFTQHRIEDKELCLDIVQEALITVARKYRAITFETSFSAWAHNVILNKVLDSHRSRKRTNERFVRMPEDIELSLPKVVNDPLLEGKLLECLKKINSTNNRQARVLNLHYQGFSTDEIANRLKMTRNGIYTVLSRARSMLRDCLAERNK